MELFSIRIQRTFQLVSTVLAMQIASCNLFVYRSPEIANFKNTEENEPGRLYTLT